MKQKIVSYTEALEIAMKLESSLIGETGAGMMQIQLQLTNLMVKLQDIKKGKEVKEEIWCTRCRTNKHHKDNFPTLMNDVAARETNPINTQGMPWCRICHTIGHISEECLYLQKIVSAPASLYCKLFKLVGHDEKDYRVL